MDELTLQFFESHPDAAPLYEAFETRVTDLIPDVKIKVQKTQRSCTFLRQEMIMHQ